MSKYPNTYREFVNMFPDDRTCADYLADLRWPNGFICPDCNKSSSPYIETRGRLGCPYCRHQSSITAGTIFDKTRTPLTIWFDIAWQCTMSKNGISAKTLERTMGLKYRMVWAILQRFRVAMAHSEREELAGEVEVDEALIGGGQKTLPSIVAIAVEIKNPRGFGRIRMRHIPDSSSSNLIPFVYNVISPGSVIHTDDWSAYSNLPTYIYRHEKAIHSSSMDPTQISMPSVHRISNLLNRWILGTHQGSIAKEHLQSYLEEYTFRFNRRTSQSRGLIFYELLESALKTPPVREHEIMHGYDWDYF